MRQPSRRSNVEDTRPELDELAARVEVASRALLSISTRASMEQPDAISMTQLRALAAVEQHGPGTLGMLADALLISASSASRLVDRLIAAGLLDRRPSQTSRREVSLQITAHGRRLLARHAAARRAVFAEIVCDMPERDVRALLRGLHAVQHRLDALTE